MQQNWKFRRGDIYYVQFGNTSTGSEQHGDRPAVIIQNDVGNTYAPTLIVVPLTSNTEKKVTQPTHCLLENEGLSIRYTCYGKLRKQTNCTGQTGYTVHILDEIIDKAVRQIFSKMRGIPKEQIVTKRYEKENAERKNHLQDLQTQRNKAEKDLLALKTEVLACIKGESVLPRETLAEMITAQEEKLTELENLCEAASEELEKTAELMDKVSRLYDELISYADLYDSANFEAKKMIVNQLIRRVDVYRGYQINISFNFDLTPYIEGE